MEQIYRDYIKKNLSFYQKELLSNIMPFWMEHGLDNVHGGIYTCLDRDGTLMDSTKSVWFQGRFAFICAYAYNHIAKNEDWLKASLSCIHFLEEKCTDKDNHKFFTVSEDGIGIQKRRYVFSECFSAMAMAEYALATQNQEYARKALDEFLNIRRMLNTPGFLEPKTTIQGCSHSITMMLINVAIIVKQVISHPDLDQQINSSLYDIENYFMHAEYKALLETVTLEGELIDSMSGRTINPGHCIETAWFIMECAKSREDKEKLNQVALQILDWSFDWGWDKEYGGILNFRDCRKFPAQDYSQDMKFWWPHCEAIIAFLYAYKLTGDTKYLKLYQQVNEWTISHFKDKEFPEWYGYLHRDGTVAQPAKGNIFKGPFHIPRMLIKASLLCKELLKK